MVMPKGAFFSSACRRFKVLHQHPTIRQTCYNNNVICVNFNIILLVVPPYKIVPPKIHLDILTIGSFKLWVIFLKNQFRCESSHNRMCRVLKDNNVVRRKNLWILLWTFNHSIFLFLSFIFHWNCAIIIRHSLLSLHRQKHSHTSSCVKFNLVWATCKELFRWLVESLNNFYAVIWTNSIAYQACKVDLFNVEWMRKKIQFF